MNTRFTVGQIVFYAIAGAASKTSGIWMLCVCTFEHSTSYSIILMILGLLCYMRGFAIYIDELRIWLD